MRRLNVFRRNMRMRFGMPKADIVVINAFSGLLFVPALLIATNFLGDLTSRIMFSGAYMFTVWIFGMWYQDYYYRIGKDELDAWYRKVIFFRGEIDHSYVEASVLYLGLKNGQANVEIWSIENPEFRIVVIPGQTRLVQISCLYTK